MLTCCPINEEVGRQAGVYLHRYRGSHGVEIGDALIAAAALSNNAKLWTRNHKHYPMKDLLFFD
jgi:predicted nucleic acid-binding protein